MRDMAVLALSPQQQTDKCEQLRAQVAAYEGDLIARAFGHRHDVVFEVAGIGVLMSVQGETATVSIGISRGYSGAISVLPHEVDADGLEKTLERYTRIARDLIRLRLGGWVLDVSKGRNRKKGVGVFNPLVDGRLPNDAVVWMGAQTKRIDWNAYKFRDAINRSTRSVERRLAKLADRPDAVKSVKTKSSAKAVAVRDESARRQAETERLARIAEAASARIGEHMREEILTERIIAATPELSAKETVDLIERVTARIGERPSSSLVAAIAEELAQA